MVLSQGIGSPVSEDSSITPWPSIIIPSVGILAPALTIRMSFSFTSSIEISCSWLFSKRRAVFGAKFINLVIASDVLFLALLSRNFPKVIKVKIIPADSKYKSMLKWWAVDKSPWPKAKLIL